MSDDSSSRWDTWSSFVSLALVVIGAVALAAEQSGSLYLVAIGPGLAFTALAAGAGFRLVSWLLAGGPGRWWQLHAMSMISGFYLWLRLGIILQAEQPLLSNPGLAVPIALALGLIIGPRERQSRVVPVGFGYWLALALLAPALRPRHWLCGQSASRHTADAMSLAPQGLLGHAWQEPTGYCQEWSPGER